MKIKVRRLSAPEISRWLTLMRYIEMERHSGRHGSELMRLVWAKELVRKSRVAPE